MPDDATGPQCVSMILCDSVTREPLSRKVNLLGVMNALRLFTVPVIYPSVRVYATLTNIKGRHEVAVVGMHEPTQRVIQTPATEKEVVSCDDPNSFLDIIASFTNLRLPDAGVYRFTLKVDDVPIAHRRLAVQVLRIELPRPPEPPAPQP